MGDHKKARKMHVVCVPFPAQGHVNPMLKLAKILHSKGFHITFVHSEYNYRRMLKSRGPNSMDGLPSFQFRAIPDGLPPSDAEVTQDISSLCRSVRANCFQPFKELIQWLNNCAGTKSEIKVVEITAPVTVIISDPSMPFSWDVGHELGIPVVGLWTASACGFLGYSQYSSLIEKGIIPFKDSNFMTDGSLEASFDWIPMKDIRLKHLPSFLRTTNRDDFMINFVPEVVHITCKYSTPLIFNTFDALEGNVLDEISKFVPGQVLSIGPMHLLLDDDENETKSLGSNLWKEDSECLKWLDSKETKSVVYVNFGSITVMTDEQLIEFAWGLANSKKTFLWIIRPDLMSGDSAVLPPNFVKEIEGRGLLASWCDQEEVLKHPSIGAFLTHCGWNSILETIINGVPILAWPFFSEQHTNCWYSCNNWKIGMEIDNNVDRDKVEKQVKELMDGDMGKEMKSKAMQWKNLAYEAINHSSGSSRLNLNKLIDHISLSSNVSS